MADSNGYYDLDLKRVMVLDNYEEMSKAAAEIVINTIKNKERTVLGMATGSTPLGLYGNLVQGYKQGKVDFSNTVSFNLDEYVGLDSGHSQSYNYYMRENLFSLVNIEHDHVNIPHGFSENSDKDCNEDCINYETKIQQSGGIDLQILGIGNNGHIGFNEPGTSFDSITRKVKLADETIKANARFFDDESDVPKYAISMGIKSIMRARKIILLASGIEKAHAIEKTVKGSITNMVPASILQLHPEVIYIVDKDAGKNL